MKNYKALVQNAHWTTQCTMKFGTLFSLFVLLFGFLLERGSFMAVCACKTAVYLFSISIVGGILLDVIATRKGMKEE